MISIQINETKRDYILAALIGALIVLFFALDAQGQTRADIGAQVSGSQNLGNNGPSYGVAGHVVTRKDRLGFEGQFAYLHAPKNQLGAGTGKHINGSGALRVYARPKIFGAMLFVAGHQSTELYQKGGAGIGGGGGYDDGLNVIQVHYDRWFDKEAMNRVIGSYERVRRFGDKGYVSIRPFALFARFGTPYAIDGVNRRLNGERVGITIAIGRSF